MRFKKEFDLFIQNLTKSLSIEDSKEWSVKGFIDCYKNIYSISTDTKVISKIIELMIFPKLLEFANNNNYELKLSPHQNYYPDITFIDKLNGNKYALDLKSTYRVDDEKVNGMTLGAFTGYFRNRNSNKNILYPYNQYIEHYVLGVIYSRTDISSILKYLDSIGVSKINKSQKDIIIAYINENSDEKWEELQKSIKSITDTHRDIIDSFLTDETKVYNIENFNSIVSVVKDFDFFIQEKYKIAIDRPGSGNTKNIGSENKIDILKSGNGLFVRTFANNAKEVFDNYWTTYETKDMAKKSGRDIPLFNNITTYQEWIKKLQIKE